MITLTIIQGVIFISYVVFLMIKFKGPLPSISDSWYQLGFPLNTLFTLFCWLLAFTMFFQTDGSTGWFFLSGAGIAFVGAATMFKSTDKITPFIHFTGAVTCIAGGFLGLYFERGEYLMAIIFAISALVLYRVKVKNETWWVEIAAFLTIITGLLLTANNH